MLHLSKPKQQTKLSQIKSASDISISTISAASMPREISNSSLFMQPHLKQQKQRMPLEGPAKVFRCRPNQENLPPIQQYVLPSSCMQAEQLKSVNLKIIVDSVMEIKRALLLYRYLEKDEEKCKKTVKYWFHESEAAFLGCLNEPINASAAQGLLQQEKKIKSRYTTSSGQENMQIQFPKSPKPNEFLLNNEVEQLKQEVEAYRRDSVEALQRLSAIMKMMEEVRLKQQAQRRQRAEEQDEKELLIATLRSYVEQSDQIVKKIAEKQRVEGRVTLIEQIASQVLMKFKFKAYATSAI